MERNRQLNRRITPQAMHPSRLVDRIVTVAEAVRIASTRSATLQTTMKHDLSRGKVHPEVATVVDNAVRGKRRAAGKPRKAFV